MSYVLECELCHKDFDAENMWFGMTRCHWCHRDVCPQCTPVRCNDTRRVWCKDCVAADKHFRDTPPSW